MQEQRGRAEDQRRTVQPPSKITADELRLRLLTPDIEEEDVISSYRRREAATLSLITHAIVITLIFLLPQWTSKGPVIVPIKEKQQSTFLTLPEDQQKVKTPKTEVLSDKDRMAQSKTPALNKEQLRKLIDASKPGPPKAAPAPPAAQQAMQENPATTQGIAPVPETRQPPPATSQLDTPVPAAPQKSPFAMSSPGAAINQAIQSAANGHAGAAVEFGGGEYGSGLRPRVDTRGGLEILSDTMGVDFGPYMKRLKFTVQNHWEPLIPESAMPPVMKKGVVVIEFAITKEGKVMGMKLISGSGDVALDRAAWGAITDAIPLPNLPVAFSGNYLLIRARFYYNPDKNDLE
jgi:TonB family protein